MSGVVWRSLVAMAERTQTARGRAQTGLYCIEGIRHHERALRAQLPLAWVLVSNSFWQATVPRVEQLRYALTQTAVSVHIIPDNEMARLTGGRQLGDIVGAISLPTPITWATINQREAPLLLVAVDIVDPGNMGALIRTAHAVGATAVFTTNRSDPFHPRAVRTSMGSLFKMPIRHYTDVDTLLAECQSHGVTTVGTSLPAETLLPQAVFVKGKTAVLLGNEYHGLPSTISQQLDQLVTIPMTTGVDSYSVNAAAAIILYEIQRQHYYADH